MKLRDLEKLTPDQVLELINSTETKLAEATATNEAQASLIVELNEKLTALEAASGKVAKPTITVQKVVYVVNSGAHLDRAYTAQEIAENPKVAAQILELEGQTILTKED